MSSTTNRENYTYWQDEGGTWEQVYADRMRGNVYYHLQELTLVEYVAVNRPASVLEIGMGVGRHVKNLREIVDTYGYDQSPTMFEVVRSISDPAWFDSHCVLGQPTGPLPYADGQVDMAFTSEVLVHVHPDDILGLLSELVRVSRWQVFHIEPSSADLIVSGDHGGCWYHDLPALYAELGLTCEVLTAPYASQVPMRVVLEPSRPPVDLSPAFVRVTRAMEAQLQPTLDQGLVDAAEAARLPMLIADRDRLWGEVQAHADEAERAAAWAQHLQKEAESLVERLDGAHARLADLTGRHEVALEQLREQGRLLSEAEGTIATLESRLTHTRTELDQALATLDATAPAAARWEEVRSARRASRPLDFLLTRARVDDDSTRRPPDTMLGRDEIGLRPDRHDEVWLLDVLDDGRARDLTAMPLAPGWQVAETENSMNGKALVGDGRAAELVLPDVSVDSALRFLQHPWSGTATIRSAAGAASIDLNRRSASIVEVDRAGQPMMPPLTALRGAITDPLGITREVSADEFWAQVQRVAPAAIGLCHPSWRGIRSSVQNLYSFCLLLDDVVTEDGARSLADELRDRGVRAVVTGGFPRSYRHLLVELHARDVKCYVTWHGSFMQYGEPYNRSSMNEVIELAYEGVVERVGFVKSGMAEIYARRGLPTGMLLNYVRTPPAPASVGSGGDRPSIGVWSVAPVWRKIPYAMVAACAELEPRPRLFASGHDVAMAALADELHVELTMLGGAVPQSEMGRWLTAMDLNLYVTLSECAPMVPLESLAVGVPCLMGPNAHYFDDDPFLEERLVVHEPDRHERIATSMDRVLQEREQIVEYYRGEFYPTHAEAARRSAAAFVDAPLDAAL